MLNHGVQQSVDWRSVSQKLTELDLKPFNKC